MRLGRRRATKPGGHAHAIPAAQAGYGGAVAIENITEEAAMLFGVAPVACEVRLDRFAQAAS